MSYEQHTQYRPRGIGVRRFLLFVFTACCLGGGLACSVLIDVEPDCDVVSDCRPYVCNAENTACLDECQTDTQCAAGFLCDRGTGFACIDQGCTATAPARSVLTLDDPILEYAVVSFGGSIWAIVGTTSSVQLARFDNDGANSGGLTELDATPSPPITPVAVGGAQHVAFFWKGQQGPFVQDVRVFLVDTTNTPAGPRVVFTSIPEQNIDQLAVTPISDGLLLGWSTFIDRSQIQFLPLNDDGTYGEDQLEMAPEDAPLIATRVDTGSSSPALATTATRPVLVRKETLDGNNFVVVSFLDSEFGFINDFAVSISEGLNIEDVRTSGMDNALAISWTETLSGSRIIFWSVATEAGQALTTQALQSYPTEPNDIALDAGAEEFGILFSALDTDSSPRMFLQRFDSAGEQLFLPIPASETSATEPSRPGLVRLSDGYGTFWVDEGSLFYRRYQCRR